MSSYDYIKQELLKVLAAGKAWDADGNICEIIRLLVKKGYAFERVDEKELSILVKVGISGGK